MLTVCNCVLYTVILSCYEGFTNKNKKQKLQTTATATATHTDQQYPIRNTSEIPIINRRSRGAPAPSQQAAARPPTPRTNHQRVELSLSPTYTPSGYRHTHTKHTQQPKHNAHTQQSWASRAPGAPFTHASFSPEPRAHCTALPSSSLRPSLPAAPTTSTRRLDSSVHRRRSARSDNTRVR